MNQMQKIERNIQRIGNVICITFLVFIIFLIGASIYQKIVMRNYGIIITIIIAVMLVAIFILAVISEIQLHKLNNCMNELKMLEKKQLEKYVVNHYDFFDRYYIDYDIDIRLLKNMRHIWLVKAKDEYQIMVEDISGNRSPIKIVQNEKELLSILKVKK